MKKRLQFVTTPETLSAIETLTAEANTNFDVGSISYSDVINEIILTTKLDIKALQRKHTDWRRSVRLVAAQPDSDLDGAIKALLALKAETGKTRRSQPQEEVSV